MVVVLIGDGRQRVGVDGQPAQELFCEVRTLHHDALEVVAVVPNIQLGRPVPGAMQVFPVNRQRRRRFSVRGAADGGLRRYAGARNGLSSRCFVS